MNPEEITEFLRSVYVTERVEDGVDQATAHREFRDWLVMQS